jgi:hypothetical protein
MTRDLDVVVLRDDGPRAIQALRKSQLVPSTPTRTEDALESMIVFVDPKTHVDVDLLIAEGDPEALAISEASRVKLFGIDAPVASLEHLLLLYLYSNQPKHLGDFCGDCAIEARECGTGRSVAFRHASGNAFDVARARSRGTFPTCSAEKTKSPRLSRIEFSSTFSSRKTPP